MWGEVTVCGGCESLRCWRVPLVQSGMPSGPSDDELGSDNPLDDTPRKKKKGSKSRKSAKGKTTKGKARKRGGAGAAEHGDRFAAADGAMQIDGAAMGGAATSAPTTARASFDKDDEVSLGVLKSRTMAAAESKKPTHSVSLPALWVKDRSSMSGKNMTSANKVHRGGIRDDRHQRQFCLQRYHSPV